MTPGSLNDCTLAVTLSGDVCHDEAGRIVTVLVVGQPDMGSVRIDSCDPSHDRNSG